MSKAFKKIYLEISNICNLQCSFCPEVERPKAVVDLLQLRQRLLQIQPLADRVCFHVMGEPLNHPHFLECIQVADELGVALEITTNGTLLNENIITALLTKNIVQVNFSLQSFIDNFPNANADKYTEKIFNFCDKALEARSDLYINLRLWNIATKDEQQTTNYFISKVEEKFNLKINKNVDPAFKKSKRIYQRIYLHFDSRFEWPNIKNAKISEQGSCYGLRSQVAIHANGSVVPCCLDKEAVINLGNIDQLNLENILNSQRATQIRQGFENNKMVERLCQSCSFAQRFS